MKDTIKITDESERVIYDALKDFYRSKIKEAIAKHGATELARKLKVDRSSILKPLERDSFSSMRNLALKIKSCS